MEFQPFNEDKDTVNVISREDEAVQAKYISGVYIWMSLALAVTGLCAYYIASNPSMVRTILQNRILFFGLMIAELGIVIYLGKRIQKMSVNTAIVSFLIYSVLNGVLFSTIFLAFDFSTLSRTFFITAGTFGVMSFFGYTTKSDLTKLGKILTMLLIGLILAMVVNIFMHSSGFDYIVSFIGVAIFVGLTAYDTQKIKRMFAQSQGAEEGVIKKLSILAALTLYLDFINLFLFLLRISGGRRS